MSQIKINRAAKIAQTGKYPRTWSEIVAKVPPSVIESVTSKQLADLVDNMHTQYEIGHTTGYVDGSIAPEPIGQLTQDASQVADQRKGRPSELIGGKRRNVYVDDATWSIVNKLGNGNASEGIRKAAQLADNAE